MVQWNKIVLCQEMKNFNGNNEFAENKYPSLTGYIGEPTINIAIDRELMSGDFVSVKITGSTEYDLMGIMEENV